MKKYVLTSHSSPIPFVSFQVGLLRHLRLSTSYRTIEVTSCYNDRLVRFRLSSLVVKKRETSPPNQYNVLITSKLPQCDNGLFRLQKLCKYGGKEYSFPKYGKFSDKKFNFTPQRTFSTRKDRTTGIIVGFTIFLCHFFSPGI